MVALEQIVTKNAYSIIEFKNLNDTDFYPFKLSKAKFAMTAHILYKNIDKNNVATFSKTIIEKIIRKK